MKTPRAAQPVAGVSLRSGTMILTAPHATPSVRAPEQNLNSTRLPGSLSTKFPLSIRQLYACLIHSPSGAVYLPAVAVGEAEADGLAAGGGAGGWTGRFARIASAATGS